MTHRGRFALVAILLAGLAWAPAAHAQDSVLTTDVGKDGKNKEIKGKVEAESARGVKISGAKELVSAEKIFDVYYDVDPLTVRLKSYRPAVDADHKAAVAKPGLRKAFLDEALKNYPEALAGLKEGQPYAQRNIEFRLAYLRALLAQETKDAATRDLAIDKLKEFKTKHANSWQIGRALKTLAELQAEAEQYAEAEQTYHELARADVSDALKESAELLAATLAVRAKKYDVAEKNLNALIAKLPKGSRQSGRAQIALGDALREAKKLDQARGVFQKVIDETKDRDLKAAAYNSLGESALAAEQYQEARWDFLWVDVVYNQDRTEHAKALYYLWKVFGQLNEEERARDCLETLLSDGQFAGTEFQRKAQAETSKQ
jgi:tetratricopeptide (TPR) repeat protein